MPPDFEQLFQPLTIGKTAIPSRIVMPGMQRGQSVDGHLLPEMIEYYARRARAGVGLIVGEGCCVDHWSSAWDGNFPRIAADTVGTWAKCADAVHRAGAAMILQISHPGAIRSDSQALPGHDGPALSASGLYKAGKPNGRAATIAELAEIRDAFARAAALAMEAGMDGVEVHACHGFFLDEFLWAETNLRTDRYGGPGIAQRMTYPLEVVSAVRAAIGPDAILSVRISQWKEMDYAARIVENAKALSASLAENGLRCVSGGTDNHLMLVDLTAAGVTGKAAEVGLDRASLTCNKNAIPFDPLPPAKTSGVRLGTPAGTTRGFGPAEFRVVGELIAQVIEGMKHNGDEGDAQLEAAVRSRVEELCEAFPVYPGR